MEEREIRPDAVAVYVRWSTDEQGEGTTLDEQLERCRNYVLSQGWRVNDQLLFVDDGYSGATLERPAMARLRQLVRQGQVDCVVSLKIDRLSRSLVDCVGLVLREWAGVCFYKSVSQPVNTTDELGRVFFAVLAGFAEYERALIRERTVSGLLRRVAEGTYWGAGKPPYGYVRAGKGRLAANPGEAETVRRIFGMAAGDRLGPAAIAARLNELGVPGPGGRGWWAFTVRSILQSRVYVGYPVYGKRRVEPRARTRGGNPVVRPRPRPLVEPAARRPELVLVPDAVFAAAQSLLRERAARAPGAGARPGHLLTGLARCRCGGPMVTGYDRSGRRYYYCQHRDRARGGTGCGAGGGFANADQVEPAVAAAVKQCCTGPEEAEADLRRHWEAEQEQGAESLRACARQLQALDRREHRLAADLAQVVRWARRGEITIDEKRAFEADLTAERQELAAERARLERRQGALAGAQAEFAAFQAWVSGADRWEALAPAARREVLCLLLSQLVVHKPKGRGRAPEVDLHWRV